MVTILDICGSNILAFFCLFGGGREHYYYNLNCTFHTLHFKSVFTLLFFFLIILQSGQKKG